jgi:dienelactone hydrolase
VHKSPIRFAAFLAAALAVCPAACAAQNAQEEIVLREALVIPPVGRAGRAATHTDAIEAAIVADRWKPPKAGETVTLPGGSTRTWEAAKADKDGWFRQRALMGGYAYMTVSSPVERIMLLDAAGHSMVYVNGEPRAGDVYANGIVFLPVLLHAGENGLLFQAGRGSLRAKLVAPRAPVTLEPRDATLPDLIAGEKESLWGAALVVNAALKPLDAAVLSAAFEEGGAVRTPVPAIPPLTVRKVGFRLPGRAFKTSDKHRLTLTLLLRDGNLRQADTLSFDLDVKAPGELYKRTFLSDIDGSVQYYAVLPDTGRQIQNPKSKIQNPALVLSLHGAGVEASGQAAAYSAKSWCCLVAPTNRRPFGFDWEEWGRMDALEALADAQKRLKTDPSRVYLTGHSMGGHGTWSFGVTFPGLFAAIGPSAGWISFQSYVGGPREASPTPMQAILSRAAASSDTLAMGHNYAALGVYILHGSADDNVPVTEARAMRDYLAGFHHDFLYHEQPGVGHWWDASPEPGTDCVDWAPMFDLFARHRIQTDEETRQVEFTTVNPGVSAWFRWACVEAQARALMPSTIQLQCDPGLRRFTGTTANVARLALRLRHLRAGAPVNVELDGQKIEKIGWPSGESILHLAKTGDRWAVAPPPAPSEKGPRRCGPFKEAFRRRMVFVYGTQGDAEENAATFAKARYDAETWWYRGNGSVDVIPDTAFAPSKERDRGVILYGNADTNSAWKPLLDDSPVQVHHDRVRMGEREETGGDLACLFLRPRPGSDTACVGVVAGTGAAGMRLAWRMPVFLSGAGFPDCALFGPEMLTEGVGGVRAAGFFGNDWGVASGEFVWRAVQGH